MTNFEACSACSGELAEICRVYREDFDTGCASLTSRGLSAGLVAAAIEGMGSYTKTELDRAGCTQAALATLGLTYIDF